MTNLLPTVLEPLDPAAFPDIDFNLLKPRATATASPLILAPLTSASAISVLRPDSSLLKRRATAAAVVPTDDVTLLYGSITMSAVIAEISATSK